MIPALLLASATTLAPLRPSPPPQGNVLVLVLDDVGCDLIGAYENVFVGRGKPAGTPADTPAIDQLLAARGLLFTNAWTSPMCTPSRARMLTGRYGFRTGVGAVLVDSPYGYARNPGLQEDAFLLPELLHLAPTPYTCVAVGKWHLADLGQLRNDTRHPLGNPAGRWFDRYAGSMFNLTRIAGYPSLSAYSAWTKTYSSYLDIGVNPCGVGVPPCDVAMVTPPATSYATVDTTEDAIRMVQTLPEPWFLYVAFNGAHLPEHAVPSGLPRASCGLYTPPSTPCDPGTPATSASTVRCMLTEVDAQIGRLLCNVDDTDTTVMLWGDNGTAPGAVLPPNVAEHHKGTVYEDGVRVPLIIRAPYQVASTIGAVTDVLVSSTDTFATVAEIAGVNPALMTAEDSVSMLPYLYGQSGSLRRMLYSETFWPNFAPEPAPGWLPAAYSATRHAQALRDGRFKLIRSWMHPHGAPQTIAVIEEFFDLQQGGPPDPITGAPTPDWFETNDLLLSGMPPASRAARMLTYLRGQLDTYYPTVVR